ncbi:MAG TPA: T9SS type A sorting domain-containing protein [Candidatus Kapabacteria bacterium]|nr:T9SS type A sorting domain-containing protein [Candidatus Kapabacteria bacterium]
MRRIMPSVSTAAFRFGTALILLLVLTTSSAFSQKSSNCSVPLDGPCCPKIVAGVNPILFFSPNKLYKFSIQMANPDSCEYHIGQKILISPDADAFSLEDGITTVGAGSSGQLIIDFGPTDSLHKYTGQLLLIAEPPCTDTTILSWEFANPLSVSPDPSNEFTVDQNYPNPVATTTTFSYTTPTEAPVTITICDITGKAVKGILSGYVSAGEHSITTDLSDLSIGTYLLLIENGNRQRVRQIIISR